MRWQLSILITEWQGQQGLRKASMHSPELSLGVKAERGGEIASGGLSTKTQQRVDANHEPQLGSIGLSGRRHHGCCIPSLPVHPSAPWSEKPHRGPFSWDVVEERARAMKLPTLIRSREGRSKGHKGHKWEASGCQVHSLPS